MIPTRFVVNSRQHDWMAQCGMQRQKLVPARPAELSDWREQPPVSDCGVFLSHSKGTETSTKAPTEASELTQTASTILEINNKQKESVGPHLSVYLTRFFFMCQMNSKLTEML